MLSHSGFGPVNTGVGWEQMFGPNVQFYFSTPPPGLEQQLMSVMVLGSLQVDIRQVPAV